MRLSLTSSNRPGGIRRSPEPLSPDAGRRQSSPPYCAWRVVQQQERRAHFNLRYSAMCDELRFGDSPSICFSTGLTPERYSSSAWYTARETWNICYRGSYGRLGPICVGILSCLSFALTSSHTRPRFVRSTKITENRHRPDLKPAGKNCGQQSCYVLRHCGDSVQGPWCNGNIALCPSRRCGFESRRVHSPYS